tara:strand:- start:2458 stop:3504 length:1047 start_codon:yes stop_codon:yes gene_type:complete
MLFFALLAFVVFVELFPELFVSIFAPGFQDSETKFLAATEFLTYVFPYILLISLVAFLGAVQNSKKSFQVVAATPILFNLTLIIFACLSETLSLKVIGTAVIVAGVIQLILNLYFTNTLGYFPSFTKKYDTRILNSFFSRFFPAILAAGVYQLNVLVDTIFASFLISGSPTWLYLSDRLIQFPMGLFGVAIALVALPDLTEQLLNKNKKEFKKVFLKGFSSTFMLGLASGLFYIFLSNQIIQLLFFRGEFTMNDVDMTSLSLVAYAYALPFLLSSKFFNSVFFAANKTKFVLTLGLISLIINLVLNYVFIFVYDMGHIGLALATTFAAISVWVIAIIYLFNLKESFTT